jgi:very-short-patch-repair endonuclease/predicted transcriptional regulator of viral defense system
LASQLFGVGTKNCDRRRAAVGEVAELRPEAMIARVAGNQHGVVTSAQLVAAGWSKDQILGRARIGWLRSVHRGVYLVGPLETPHTAAMAAVLATGGTISHYPAAVLWDWRPPREEPIHLTLPSGAHNRAGIVVHRASLHPRDITRRHGIPVTSAARTILDLAATEPTAELERALNEAGLQRRVSPHSLNEQFSRYPRHRGTAALKRLLESEPHLTRSDAEVIVRDLIRTAGLPQPEANVRVEGFEVDLVWRAQRLVVEIDSWAFHSMRRSFEGDRRRDQLLVGKGWRVIRITARQLAYEPHAVVATLATALAA